MYETTYPVILSNWINKAQKLKIVIKTQMKIRKQPKKYKKETKTETKKTWKSSHLMKRF